MPKTKNTPRHSYDPDYAVAPGNTLQETIAHLGIDQAELAERTGLAKKTLNQIIKGKAPLSQQTALLLERVTNVPARMWNNLEANYREQLAKLAARDEMRQQAEWLKQVPTKELIARGYLQATNDVTQLLEQTLCFFRVASVAAWREGWGHGQFAFRKSTQVQELDCKLAAWLRIAEATAEQIEVATYSKSKFASAVADIREMTCATPEKFLPAMRLACEGAGVALCLVPEIPGGKISGAAKWITKDKAMIAVNLRGKKNDLFWFTFFHEAGHILHDSKKRTYVDVAYTDDPCEHQANRFARDMLIPDQHSQRLKQLKTAAQVISFAREIGIAPGIVVGRLQHERIVQFSHLNSLKETYMWSEQ